MKKGIIKKHIMPWVCRNSLETQPNTTCTFLKKVGSGGDETGNTEGCLGGSASVLRWGRVGGGGRWLDHGAVASSWVDWSNWGSGGWGHWGGLNWLGLVDWRSGGSWVGLSWLGLTVKLLANIHRMALSDVRYHAEETVTTDE